MRERLAQLKVPTLVIHSRGDQRVSLDQAKNLAASIPGAEFVTLDSSSHTPLAREPAFADMIMQIERFLGI